MGKAKEVKISVIASKKANMFIKKHHYSGKVVNNSSLHFGCFLGGYLGGVMSFGPPLDKQKVLGFVKGTQWNEMLELNRMAFSEYLPRNSESRCLSVAFRLIKKNAPQIKWVLSFSDATQCGDGIIYRASGFDLVGIKKNKNTVRLPSGNVIHKMTLESNPTRPRKELGGKSYYDLTGGRYDFNLYAAAVGGEILEGFQMSYIKLLYKGLIITKEIIPFSKIAELGAGMYKGKKQSA